MRRPTLVRYRAEINRSPDLFGLPDELFGAIVTGAVALWACSGFHRIMLVLALGLLFVGTAELGRLTRHDPLLPLRRLQALRYPRALPAFTQRTRR